MHTVHTTPGFIIGSRTYGDAGKILAIFTRDFGLVYATAQGIRLEKSKLRYHTQDYSFGLYSLVRGREYWRLTSANDSHTPAQEMIARTAMLLRRLLHGEEAHQELFDCVFECIKFLGKSHKDDQSLLTLESLTVARMLYALGYIGNVSDLNGHLQSTNLSIQLLDGLKDKRKMLNQHINKALKESML